MIKKLLLLTLAAICTNIFATKKRHSLVPKLLLVDIKKTYEQENPEELKNLMESFINYDIIKLGIPINYDYENDENIKENNKNFCLKCVNKFKKVKILKQLANRKNIYLLFINKTFEEIFNKDNSENNNNNSETN